MKLKSLGYKSELIFTSFDGKVEDRGSYLVVKTPTNPNFFWGNLLIFERPPLHGEYEEWVGLFKREFSDPRIYHMTFAWDSSDAAIEADEFIEKDFELETNAILSATALRKPPKFNEQLEVRPLQNENEWREMIGLQTSTAHDYLPREEWDKFYTSQSFRYQKMIRAGWGHWYGGFLGDKLVAGLGIFHHAGIGRYQIVCTHPEYQRRGICGTLVYQSGLHAVGQFHLNTLVMRADPNYHAVQIYESVGFERQQLERGIYWWDKNSAR